MKLERIITRGFMGAPIDETLTAANVYVATNWTGKTKRANAITLLLLGYVPKLGKTNKEIMRLASAREMHVEGIFTGGGRMSRTFTMKGASVTCKTVIPDELKNEGELAIMLNAGAYFGLSDQGRVDYVFGLLDMAHSSFTEETMLTELKQKTTERIGDDEATRKAVAALVEKIRIAVNDTEKDLPRDAACAPGEDPAITPQQWLSLALEQTAEFTKSAKEYAARMEKTVQGITTLKLADTTPTPNLAAVEAERERVTRERDGIVQRREELQAKKRQIDHARRERIRITDMLGMLQPKVKALVALRAKLAENTAGTEAAQRERDAIIARKTELDAQQTAIDEAAICRREINSRLPALQRAKDKAQACRDHMEELDKRFSFEKLTAAGTAITEAEEARRFNTNEQTRISRDLLDYRRQLTAHEEALKGIESATKCPTCGASGEGWKTLRTVELNTEIQKVSGEIAALSDELQELVAAEVELNGAVTAKKKAHAALLQLGRERDQLERESRGYAQDVESAQKLESELNELPAEDPTLKPELSAVNQKWTATGAALEERRKLEADITKAEAATADVHRLNAELTALTPDDPQMDAAITAVSAEYDRNYTRANELDQLRRLAEKRQHDAQRAAEAEQQRTDALAEVAVSKSAAEVLKDIQGRFVAAAFDPVLKSANEHFGAILSTPLAYHDGEIGTWRDGIWIAAHKTFSGAEERLAFCAISMALAARSRIKVAIIDELGTVADENVKKLLAAVRTALKAGFITQFIGIDAGRVDLYRGQDSQLNVRELEV